MTLDECLQWAQRWAVRINDDNHNPYECYFESKSLLFCALYLAEKDQHQWVIDCMYVVSMMIALKTAAKTYTPRPKPIGGKLTVEGKVYNFKYRGINEPDTIRNIKY